MISAGYSFSPSSACGRGLGPLVKIPIISPGFISSASCSVGFTLFSLDLNRAVSWGLNINAGVIFAVTGFKLGTQAQMIVVFTSTADLINANAAYPVFMVEFLVSTLCVNWRSKEKR